MELKKSYPLVVKPWKLQRGVSLVELMIALLLGLLLTLGVLQLYSMFKDSSRYHQAASRLLENGRVAISLLNRDLRMTRYWGCAGSKVSDVTNHLLENPAASQAGMTLKGIYGQDNAGPYADSDNLTVFLMQDSTVTEVIGIDDPDNSGPNPDPLSADAIISVKEGSGYEAGDYVVINDCLQGDIIELSGVTTDNGVPDQLAMAGCFTCTKTYSTSATVNRIKRRAYSIRLNPNLQPALYVKENGGVNQELIEGVEDMQIYFGEDVDGDRSVDRYVPASVIDAACIKNGNANCWNSVASVRISLLMRSTENNVTQTPQTYSFNGAMITATDDYYRREFNTIVQLRNFR